MVIGFVFSAMLSEKLMKKVERKARSEWKPSPEDPKPTGATKAQAPAEDGIELAEVKFRLEHRRLQQGSGDHPLCRRATRLAGTTRFGDPTSSRRWMVGRPRRSGS